MNVDLTIKLNQGSKIFTFNTAVGTQIETLAKKFQCETPYRILSARVNNTDICLNETIKESCALSFLDMRDPSANAIYQRSVSFLYLKAVYDVLGSNRVLIENSLNKGLFTQMKQNVTIEELESVEDRMRQLVDDDLPFIKGSYPRQKAIEKLRDIGYVQKLRLLENTTWLEKVPFYSLDEFENFFYGPMVPSTGYIEYFELRKCRRGVLLRFPEPKFPNQIPLYRDDIKLYRAFGEAREWARLMEISYVQDLNEKVDDGSYKEVIQISEALHEKKIAEIADEITQDGKRIILIAGPSSSGKTTFAQRLCIQLRVNGLKPLYMGTDDYFLERDQTPVDENGEYNFEDIDAIDRILFNHDMNALLAGEEVDLPVFDFQKGKKIFGKRIIKAKRGQPIVIEGIHGLNKELTSEIPDDAKYKIYISPLTQLNIDTHNRIPTTDARLIRRIVRDSQFRGYSAQHTIKLWPKVRTGEDKNIFPFNGEADVLFNSAHIYELSVLKKYAEPLLKAIKPEEPEYSEACRLLQLLQFFRTVKDDSMIANHSIIREFIGGSIFVD
ncbi:MAG: nucleoside kinase [Anaerovorax sp.]|nr:nucleoside kinase [Anaerovorax sp.]